MLQVVALENRIHMALDEKGGRSPEMAKEGWPQGFQEDDSGNWRLEFGVLA